MTVSIPLYRSDDDGQTWVQQGSVLGADAPAGIYLQPYLYELPRAFGGLPKGTMLFSCNYWPFDFTKPFPFASTIIQLYASTDAGLTWEFLSTVAQGGPPDTTNAATPVLRRASSHWAKATVLIPQRRARGRVRHRASFRSVSADRGKRGDLAGSPGIMPFRRRHRRS